MRDINTQLSSVDGSTGRKINEEITELICSIDHTDLKAYHISSHSCRTHILFIRVRIDHMLIHKTSLSKFKIINCTSVYSKRIYGYIVSIFSGSFHAWKHDNVVFTTKMNAWTLQLLYFSLKFYKKECFNFWLHILENKSASLYLLLCTCFISVWKFARYFIFNFNQICLGMYLLSL